MYITFPAENNAEFNSTNISDSSYNTSNTWTTYNTTEQSTILNNQSGVCVCVCVCTHVINMHTTTHVRTRSKHTLLHAHAVTTHEYWLIETSTTKLYYRVHDRRTRARSISNESTSLAQSKIQSQAVMTHQTHYNSYVNEHTTITSLYHNASNNNLFR